jgi:hypothetical protein
MFSAITILYVVLNNHHPAHKRCDSLAIQLWLDTFRYNLHKYVNHQSTKVFLHRESPQTHSHKQKFNIT